MKRNIVMVAIAMMFLISPALACVEEEDGMNALKVFLAWDKTDLLDNATLSSEQSSTMAENAYDNGIDMGIVKFYNPDEKVGYYFAYTEIAGEIVYIDAETDNVFTSIDTAKNRLSYRGVEFTDICYSQYFPGLDLINEDMKNTIPQNIVIN